ncbi:ParB/RepB/Spo0J family partition protein [Brevundimonas sp. 2R-24]|uniref:ParB/RepB/Spo0J family partition protein n=1 Tax=Peiella sedimenti TaxID=3061083 RepID=A0ABT8SKJ5_9CAUL|nr:ParB/RepB/Spo0J family partition protein [Caulobacteraceae bacterium XZ-24]
MNERHRGLGRGLSALLGEAEEADDGDVRPARPDASAPIELLKANPDQPRRHFNDADLEELTASVRERGILQPILVRPDPEGGEGYQIVAGERRWRAAQRAGLRDVPILVRTLDDAQVLELAIIENVQRADLNALEEAAAYRDLMERFGHTQDAVAQIVGKSRSHVANTLRLLALPKSVEEHLLAGRLTAGHARALINAPDPEALAERVVREGLSVRRTEALAREEERPRKPPTGPRRTESDPDSAALAGDLSDALGMSVEVRDRGGKGELVLRYASLEQLDDLARRLMRS